MPVSAKPRPIPPPREREGYEVDYGQTRHRAGNDPVYNGPRSSNGIELEPWWKRPGTEAQLGLLTFGGGAIWSAKVETIQIANIFHLLMKPGPLELSAVGLLIWLHAKWRSAVRVR